MLLFQTAWVTKLRNTSKANFDADTEFSSSSVCDGTKERNLGQALKKLTSLKDLSLELRKKEASKRLYLTRYE
jgi:hypothetical protein